MYFGVLGKTPDLSLEELKLVSPDNVTTKGGIVFFDTDIPEKIPSLGGLIKRGEVVSEEKLQPYIKDAKIVGVDSEELGLMMKRKYGVRRYKVIDLRKSDLDCKKKGGEIRFFGKGSYGIVIGRQNIDLYSIVDFERPANGMQIGMMPAKLAHILISLGCSQVQTDVCTVYDPFCGFGTTNFVANYLGHHTIGSDINITPAKQNKKRREKQKLYNKERMITYFKHDVNDPFEKPFLSSVDVIVSEGRLGPVIKSEMHKHKDQTERILKEYIPSIVLLYSAFLTHTKEFMDGVPIVITIPEYLRLDTPIIADRIVELASSIGYDSTYVGEVYQRKKQQVGRRVVIFS